MLDGDYYGAMEQYFNAVDYLYAHGEPPKEPASFGFSAICGIILGVIVGFVAMAVLVAQMKPVRRAAHAVGYLVPGSFRLGAKQDHYLYSTVSKHLRPKNTSSSGGKSGYSRSFSSSGGRSFSGGGRKF